NSSNALGMFNMFSGNAAQRLSIISLGIMPYITASIIMELLAATFPTLGKMKKERDGMVKYMQIIRYATIVITIVQAIGVSVGLGGLSGRAGESAIMIDMTTFTAIAAASMLTGTMLLMWIGEQITQRGIGNGISLIIFAGIVSGIPSAIGGTINLVNTGELNFLVVIGILAVILATVGSIIYVEMGERRIPISYSRKVVLQNQHKRIMNYVPIKMNLSGVSYVFNVLTFLFVIFFAYFYASIVFNAKDISENLKKQGGFIPGVRPGESTALFLNEVAGRLTLWGSIYLGLISTLPWVLVKVMGVPFYFGGTAVLIVVQVALDTMRKIEAQMYMNKYETLSAVGL
ncbi:MAG: preprotein translocase secY subunit, partial [Proteobacteria bacterium]|nr:preprotein translocase secY subunit [Pseudomonadota bacterium]